MKEQKKFEKKYFESIFKKSVIRCQGKRLSVKIDIFKRKIQKLKRAIWMIKTKIHDRFIDYPKIISR